LALRLVDAELGDPVDYRERRVAARRLHDPDGPRFLSSYYKKVYDAL
jgi:hypothetical protein